MSEILDLVTLAMQVLTLAALGLQEYYARRYRQATAGIIASLERQNAKLRLQVSISEARPTLTLTTRDPEDGDLGSECPG